MNNFKYKGYIGKLLRVNLTRGSFQDEPLTNELAEKYIGGAGMAARILYDELAPGIDPFSEDNKLIILTGPIEGTMIPTSCRIGAYAKSPLTNSFFHSSAGGHFAPELKFAGYDGIIFEGKAPQPVYLFLDEGHIELRDAIHLWGKKAYATQLMLHAELGSEEIQIAAIGPAGEKLVRFACIICGCRAMGRGGLGAVMGSKNLKALAVRGHGSIEIPDISQTEAFLKEIYERFEAAPATSQILPNYGTPVLVNANNSLGLFGYKNWQDEFYPEAEGLSGDTMKEKIVKKNKSCYACPARCGKYSIVAPGHQYEGAINEGPEYEDIFSLGSMCGHNDIQVVCAAERLCDDLGMDAIESGVAIAFAMECYEKGLISNKETDGIELTFGRADLILPMIEKMAMRQGHLGDLLAEGVKRASDKIGQGSEFFAMHNKGLTFAGHSARGMPGFALGYATGPRGGSHHDGRPTGERTGIVKREILDGKGEYTARINHFMILTDSMILCHLPESVWGPLDVTELLTRCINVVTGMDMTHEDGQRTAERIWNLIRAFSVREGYGRKDDKLPPRFMEEPIKSGVSKGMVISRDKLDNLLDQYYAFRGWDKETGIPTRDRLVSLGLDDIADDMEKCKDATKENV
jgi:aldehyde:ferredoxin oxidoreductase